MQTLSSPISPTIPRKSKVADVESDFSPAIAKSSALQTALAGLDASLNDELDRYRHWQDNGQTISYLNPFRPRAVSKQSIWTSPSLSEALYPAIASSVESQSDHRTIQMPVMPPMGAVATSLTASISAAELHRYKGLEDLQSIENDIVDEKSVYAQDLNGYGEDTLVNDRPSSPKMAQLPQPDDDDILQSFANDYAEQYQEAANEDFSPIPTVTKERSALRNLMNPVGIISLLLLLFSSAAIGYLMVDPAGVMKLFKPEATPKAAQEQAPEVGSKTELGSELNLPQGGDANDSVSFIPFAKDKNSSALTIEDLIKDKPDSTNKVDNKSFDPKSLSAIPTQKPSGLFASRPSFVTSAPLRTVPSAALPPISVAPIAPAIAPVERSYSAPPAPVQRSYEEPAPTRSYSPPARRQTPVRVTRAVAPTPVAPARPAAAVAPTVAAARSNTPKVKYAAPLTAAPEPVSAVPAPAAASSYRVVVESSYAASAQQVEREAYVRPSDGQVQMGAYRDPNVAQQRIEELRRQGIPARIE